MKFKYKAKTQDNQTIEGVKDAPDKFALAREIRKEGYTPFSIEEFGFAASGLSMRIKFFDRISLAEKIMFTNNLHGMLSAGLSITRALNILAKQSTNIFFKEIMESLVESIDKGNTLSESMKKYPKVFSELFISMVKAGEESGSLPKTLLEIGINLKKSYDLNKKIKGAMTYPSIIVIAIFIIGILMMMFVVPSLTKTFTDMGTDLPASTKFVIWVSDTLSHHILGFIFVVIGFCSAVYFLFKLKIIQIYFDLIITKLPMIGELVREMNSARTTRTLSSLLSAGVDMSRALSITKDVLQNYHYKKIIEQAAFSIEKGGVLSQSFKSHLKFYPVMVGEMMEVGEETGNLSKMLVDIANFYESEVDNKTKDLSTIIEPVLMIFIGGAVGFFAISMITPMYKVMDTIN